MATRTSLGNVGSSSFAPAPRANSPVVVDIDSKVWRGLPTDMWRSVAAFSGSPSLPATSKKHTFLTCNKAMCDTGYPSPAAVNDLTVWYPPAQRYEHCARPCLQERVRALLEWWNTVWKLGGNHAYLYLTLRLTDEARAQQPRLQDEVVLVIKTLGIVDNKKNPTKPSFLRYFPVDEEDNYWDWSDWIHRVRERGGKEGVNRNPTMDEIAARMLTLREEEGAVSFVIVTKQFDDLESLRGERTALWMQQHPEAIASVSVANARGETIQLPRGYFDREHPDRFVYIIPYLRTPELFANETDR